MNNSSPLLSLENLSVEFSSKEQNFQAVKELNLKIYPGEVVAPVGESGSGKTITSLSIMNLLPENARINGGTINFSGKNKSIIFQEPMTSLNPLIKIGKQIEESGLCHGMTKPQANSQAEKLAALTGLENTRRIFNCYPHELSGGMRQRVMIASALMTNPELLIADEPTTALDVSTQNKILSIFQSLKREFNTSLLLITHDFTVVKKLCTRIYIMYKGQIVEEGQTKEVLENPQHPYTKALIDSIPDAKKRLKNLPGFLDKLASGNFYGEWQNE